MRVAPKKSLGQNFLVDRKMARRIVDSLELAPGDQIVEIGPGEGALTEYLIESGAKVTAVEIDPRSAEALRERFGDRLTIVEQDFLQIDLGTILDPPPEGGVTIVGNIPYYITSPILFHLFDNREAVKEATLMMQKEVAERLVAQTRTKAYGILSVITQSLTEPKRLFNVPPGCFFPKPRVTSTVVRFRFQDRVDIVGIEKIHRRVVRAGFSKRRKTLNNALSELISNGDERRELFERSGIGSSQRAEELTAEEFAHLARVLADETPGKPG